MDESTFEKVIKRKDYVAFFLGEKDYFILDREYGEHWVYGMFIQVLNPYARKHGEVNFETEFWNGIINCLNYQGVKENLILNSIVNHLHIFYEFSDPTLTLKRLKSTPKKFPSLFIERFLARKNSLETDKRSVGVEWNTVNNGKGLWGGVLYNLGLIESKGGPKIYSNILNKINMI